jgi:uncharacterized YccA/Bax inhibitor family protein
MELIIMRSSNPVFASIERSQAYSASGEVATYRGIIFKTGLLFAIAILSGYLALSYFPLELLFPMIIGSAIIALISVIIASRSLRLAPVFSILYAVTEGLILVLITVLFDAMAPGVALAAVIATAAIFTVMLFLYSSRTIRVTPRFRRIMYASLLGIMLFIVIGFFLSLLGIQIGFSEPVIILISSVFIIFGALMLTMDFDRAEMIVSGEFDKGYEWMVAVGLMVTIIWIYFELLRLFFILANNRR